MVAQNDALASASIQEAQSDIGQKEMTGHNDGPFVNMLQEWYGGAAEHGAPWCALFCTHCIYIASEKLGVKPLIPKSDSSTFLYSFAVKNGLLLSTPIAKCIGLMRGDGGTAGKTHHHTFRVLSVDLKLGIVHTIDGNWGNQVAITTHRIQDCDFMVVV